MASGLAIRSRPEKVGVAGNRYFSSFSLMNEI